MNRFDGLKIIIYILDDGSYGEFYTPAPSWCMVSLLNAPLIARWNVSTLLSTEK